jgi:hypothetical protein
MKLSLLLILFMTVSCSSVKPGKAYVETKEYQSRPKITQSYYKDGNKSLSDDQIKNLLSQKVELSKSLKIAVVKLGHEFNLTTIGYSHDKGQQTMVIKDELVNSFEKIKGPTKRIKEIALVPKIIMPNNPNLENLRDVAAIMQADIVLVLDTKSKTDSKFHIHKENEAKAVATVEAIALDVKTGVIPFTSIATNSAHLKEDHDFNNDELYLRAMIEAENRAINEIAENLGNYFN